jgi:fructose/tagatose bisphosphate aldolase
MSLSREDRITAAGIAGVAEGHIGGIGSRAAAHEQLMADLAVGHGEALAAAITEIHGRLPADPQRRQAIMDEAAARYTLPNGPRQAEKLQLLLLAGADGQRAREIQTGRG